MGGVLPGKSYYKGKKGKRMMPRKTKGPRTKTVCFRGKSFKIKTSERTRYNPEKNCVEVYNFDDGLVTRRIYL